MASTFLGTTRKKVLEDLVAAFDQCVEDGRPRLVCLEAESGWGKSRIVQELYQHLQRERQPLGKYWPEEFGAKTDPMRDRKVIAPRVPPSDDAPMPWFWWGLRCDRDSSGRAVRALVNDRDQLGYHLKGFLEAAQLRASNTKLALAALAQALAFIPAVGPVASWLVTAGDQGANIRAFVAGLRQSTVRRPRELSEPDPEDIAAEIDLVEQFVTAELPLILVIDDAHDTDAATRSFLAALWTLRRPIFVVATAWPSKLRRTGSRAHESHEEASDFERVLRALEQRAPERVTRHVLEPFEPGELEPLIADVAPNTSAEARQALLEVSDGNPLVLRLQLSSPKVRRSIRDGAITLDARELRSLPRQFAALVADRFLELSEPSRHWLAEAAMQGPTFFPEFVSSAPVGEDELGAFVRRNDSGGVATAQFVESAVHQAVAQAALDEYSDAERQRWHQSLFERLQEHWNLEEPEVPEEPAQQARLARLTLELAGTVPEITVEKEPRALTNAALYWSWAERDLDRHSEEYEAARAALRWALERGVDSVTAARAHTRLSSAIRYAKVDADAIEPARHAVALLDTEPEVRVDELETALVMLALACLHEGDFAAARSAAKRAHNLHGPSEVWALETLATIEWEAGEAQAAADAVDRALALAEAADDPDFEDLLRIEAFASYVRSSVFLPPDRLRRLVARAEDHLGLGHYHHRGALGALAVSLLATSEGPDKLARVIDELRRSNLAAGLAEDDGILMLLDAVSRGDRAGTLDAVDKLANSSGMSRRMRGWIEELPRVMQAGTVWAHAPEQDLIRIAGRLRSDADGAIRELAEIAQNMRDDPDGETWYGIAQLAGQALSLWLLHEAEVHEVSEPLTRRLRACAPPHANTVRPLAEYEAALRVLSGEAVSPPQPAPIPLMSIQTFGVRAVASQLAGRDAEADDAIAHVREAAEEVGGFVAWSSAAVAFKSSGRHELALEAWDLASAATEANGSQRGRAMVGRGEALLALGRASESIVVLEVALARLDEETGPAHAYANQARRKLADALEATGRWGDATPLRRAVLARQRQRWGADDARTRRAHAALTANEAHL